MIDRKNHGRRIQYGPIGAYQDDQFSNIFFTIHRHFNIHERFICIQAYDLRMEDLCQKRQIVVVDEDVYKNLCIIYISYCCSKTKTDCH